jgi:hypothetical protein
MGLAGALDLRDVSTIELDLACFRQRVRDVPGERDRNEAVAPAPDEERIRLQAA